MAVDFEKVAKCFAEEFVRHQREPLPEINECAVLWEGIDSLEDKIAYTLEESLKSVQAETKEPLKSRAERIKAFEAADNLVLSFTAQKLRRLFGNYERLGELKAQYEIARNEWLSATKNKLHHESDFYAKVCKKAKCNQALLDSKEFDAYLVAYCIENAE